MVDGDNSLEGNFDGEPEAQDVFVTAVNKVKTGKASKLLFLDADTDVKRFKGLNVSIIKPFIDKTRSFLESSLDVAQDTVMLEQDKVPHLSSVFKTAVDEAKVGEGAYSTSTINIQTMNLGALTFVGESTQLQANDPTAEETEEITRLLRETSESHLNDREQNIVSALAKGIEIGYGNVAPDRFGKLVASIRAHTEKRTAAPVEVGDDFIEALLTTKF